LEEGPFDRHARRSLMSGVLLAEALHWAID
jgi:hypothetical protein